MILDESHVKKRPCRIFCTQPRRIAALTISERVAAERNESVGQTVGFQIRLESRYHGYEMLGYRSIKIITNDQIVGIFCVLVSVNFRKKEMTVLESIEFVDVCQYV